MRIAYLSENPNKIFPDGNIDAKERLEARLPNVSVEVFESPAKLVGRNWDGPLFKTKYNVVMMGIRMPYQGTPIEGEKCGYGKTTGIEIYRRVMQDPDCPNFDSQYMFISIISDPNYWKQFMTLSHSGSSPFLVSSSEENIFKALGIVGIIENA